MAIETIEKEVLPIKEFRKKIVEFEEAMMQIPGAHRGDWDNCPLTHTFAEGIYVRKIFMPMGALIVSKIHKASHPYFVLQGELSVLTEEGEVRIKAPYYGITPSGTKRLLYVHEDTVWVTVHATKETDLEKIEEEIIAKSFDELPEGKDTTILTSTSDPTEIILEQISEGKL
jgi:hypothetical protein